MEDFFYRELLKYLGLAEAKRRWNVFKDIPWEHANPDSSEVLAQCVETFCAVEMYLPDFTSKLLQMIRRSRGRAWFHINWGYEESKHSMALEGWLVASGHRSEEQREEFENELLGQEWELPFDHPRQMVCYTMIQELATFWNYRNLEKIAAKERDHCLVTALRIISVDERVHYTFFRHMVKEWFKWDEEGTIKDLKYVFDNFVMPGSTQIPGYGASARILAKTGIYGPREYIKLVKNPILEDLKLDKDFKKIEDAEELAKAEKAAKAAMNGSVERIEVGNGHAVPRTPTGPLNANSLNKALNGRRAPGSNWDSRDDIPTYENGRKRSPLLDAFGVLPKVRNEPSYSVILGSDDVSKIPGSRGMQKLDNAIDQQVMAIGDELSNTPEELRAERDQLRKDRDITRKSRGKNDRLFKKYEEEQAAQDSAAADVAAAKATETP